MCPLLPTFLFHYFLLYPLVAYIDKLSLFTHLTLHVAGDATECPPDIEDAISHISDDIPTEQADLDIYCE